MDHKELKEKATKLRVPYWEIGRELGKCENTIARWMRDELPPERAEAISAAIDRIVARRATA